jgi:signal peptidase I
MSLDFPLILVILVFGTGLIWLADRVLFAPGRQRGMDALCTEFPWEDEGSPDARRFRRSGEGPAAGVDAG